MSDPIQPDHYQGDYVMRIIEDFKLDFLSGTIVKQLGVFWQRPDLTHFHDHWGRPREGETMGRKERMPDFLIKANSTDEWHKSKKEFERLKAGGFAECLPL
jgi:hypothetical protein